MTTMLQVTEKEGGPVVLFPLEEDGTLASHRIQNYFKGYYGLRYRNKKTNAIRGLRYLDGKFYPPEGGWNGIVYFCEGSPTSSKDKLKRKLDDREEVVAEKIMRCETKPIDLILLGLMQDTTESHIRECFAKYGDLELVSIKRDSKGVSKGFGFIRFTDYESQKTVMGAASPFYSVNGHWCEVKIPNSKIKTKTDVMAHDSKYLESKIFVGRCALDITPSDLRQYFSRYGEVTHVYVPPNRAKPYAFVTFNDHEVAQSLWGEDHTIKGHSVNVRPAEKSDPRNERANQSRGNNHGKAAPSRKTSAENCTAACGSQNEHALNAIIQNSRLSTEVLSLIKDILVADRLCSNHPPVYYTNMLSKKLTLLRLVEILQSQGQLLPILEKFQETQSDVDVQRSVEDQDQVQDQDERQTGNVENASSSCTAAGVVFEK